MLAAAAGILVAAGAAYIGAAQKYRQVFFPNTVINGVGAAGLTADQMKARLEQEIRNYKLTLKTRTGDEQVMGEEIGLHAEYDGTLEKLLDAQDPYAWGLHLFQGTSSMIDTMTVYDEQKLEEAVSTLVCMDEGRMTEPVDAKISDYIDNVGYEIIPEQPGTRLYPEKVQEGVADAVRGLQRELSLEELDAYLKPTVASDDETLLAELADLNKYAQMTVTYNFGAGREILDGNEIHKWISKDEQGNPIVDDTQVQAYVEVLAEKYDTAYQPKELKTSYGDMVTITRGNYGWKIDQKQEAAALKEIVLSGQGQEREPIYLQTAASRDGADYGNTYVEVNLTGQHLFYYKDGALVVESDFVSGNMARGMGTPAGAYPITYKQRNATLKGQGYTTPVSYWMPFNRGIGLHDASWRNKFGGSIYRTNGSHGCINLPSAVARTIYENIEAGVPVLCYYLDGTSVDQVTTVKHTAPAAVAQPPVTQPAPVAAEVPVPVPVVPDLVTAEVSTQPAPVQEQGQTGPGVSVQGGGSSPGGDAQEQVTAPGPAAADLQGQPQPEQAPAAAVEPEPAGPGPVQPEMAPEPAPALPDIVNIHPEIRGEPVAGPGM